MAVIQYQLRLKCSVHSIAHFEENHGIPYSGTQRPNCWNAAGETEAGCCSNAFWVSQSIVSDFAGLVGKKVS